MATKTRLTLDEFLALPETEPACEFINGEVVQKVSPNIPHSALAAWLAARFLDWASVNEQCLVGVEGRHVDLAAGRAYLPDIHVTKMSRLAGHETENPMTVAPDVAVEILSPDDRPSAVLDKVQMYLELEIPALLVVDPGERTVRDYRPGSSPRTLSEGDTLDLSPVLPGFTLPLAGLFSVIPGP